MTQLILLRGYPGAGKTTVGKALEKDGLGIFIDHNAILTFLADIVGNDDGIYEEIHALEKAMANKLLSEGKSVIVARGFSSNKRLEEYVSLTSKLGAKSVVFTLNTPLPLLESRVQSQERKNNFNPTVTPEKLRLWVKDNPIEPFASENIIDCSQPVNKVVEEIKRLLAIKF